MRLNFTSKILNHKYRNFFATVIRIVKISNFYANVLNYFALTICLEYARVASIPINNFVIFY